MTDILEFIHNRHSDTKLTEPAPAGVELEEILGCALKAPDHALLRPWRYLVLQGSSRARLGDAWAEAVVNDDPSAGTKAAEKARGKPLRAPMIIVAITRVHPHPKVPAIEQHLSTGVGVGYLLLALQARGFGAIWRTGAMAYHPRIRDFLELEPGEAVSGFLYVGTPARDRPASPMPVLADHVSYWD